MFVLAKPKKKSIIIGELKKKNYITVARMKKIGNIIGIKEKEMYREMRISYVFDIFSDLGDL